MYRAIAAVDLVDVGAGRCHCIAAPETGRRRTSMYETAQSGTASTIGNTDGLMPAVASCESVDFTWHRGWCRAGRAI